MLKMLAAVVLAVSIGTLAFAAASTPDVGPHGFAKNFGAMRLPPAFGGSDPSTACVPCGFLAQRR